MGADHCIDNLRQNLSKKVMSNQLRADFDETVE